jgi:hypothetical protein
MLLRHALETPFAKTPSIEKKINEIRQFNWEIKEKERKERKERK